MTLRKLFPTEQRRRPAHVTSLLSDTAATGRGDRLTFARMMLLFLANSIVPASGPPAATPREQYPALDGGAAASGRKREPVMSRAGMLESKG